MKTLAAKNNSYRFTKKYVKQYVRLCKTSMRKKILSSIIKCLDDKKYMKKFIGFSYNLFDRVFYAN